MNFETSFTVVKNEDNTLAESLAQAEINNVTQAKLMLRAYLRLTGTLFENHELQQSLNSVQAWSQDKYTEAKEEKRREGWSEARRQFIDTWEDGEMTYEDYLTNLNNLEG